MSDTLTGTATARPPTSRSTRWTGTPRCPFAPPPAVMELGEAKPLSRVRIWDGSTPWLITGYEAGAGAVRRLPGQRRRPAARLPALERAHAVHGEQAAAVGVHLRRRGAHPVPPDAVQAVHLQAGRGPAAGHPEDHRRVHRRDPGRPAARRHRHRSWRCRCPPGDQRDAGRALRGRTSSSSTTPTSASPATPPAEDGAKGRHEPGTSTCSTWSRPRWKIPAEDAVSDLAERVKAGELSVKEAAQLGTGLLIAGHETTANMIGIGVLALLENPDQAALLRDTDDPKFIANAVEELMRYLSIIQNGQRRVAIEDIEIAGETIRAGEGIIIDLAPANWDAERVPRTRQAGPASRERRPATSASATAGTSASDSSSPAPNCRSCSTPCCAAFPRCGSPSRSTRCRSSTTASPTASTNFR